MAGTKVWFGNLDLAPGYYAERGETGVVAPARDARKTGHQPPLADPEPGGWQELCHSLLIRLSQKSAECERLRVRETELDERLRAAERDQAIAEDIYGFSRKRVRQVADRRQRSRRRGLR